MTLLNKVESLISQYFKNQTVIADLCRGIMLTESLGENLIYSGCSNGRPYRMLMFVLLLNESVNLKDDYRLAYHLLKEAYLMTDNIYGQLKQSPYPFVLADYLKELELALPNRNGELLHEEEKALFDSLPQTIKVYRGMCEEEKLSGNYGISWTLDADYALNYVFYKKNDVVGSVGWRAEMEIDRNEIFAVWGVVGERKEIVISPKKCIDVRFRKVVR